MTNAIVVQSLEQLLPYLNEKNVLEIVVRESNKRIKAFQKVAIDNLAKDEQQELLKKAIHALNAKTGMSQKNLQLIQQVSKIQSLGLILNGLNLCATCVGFVIIYAKLNSMSAEINQQFSKLQHLVKQGHELQTSHELDKVLSEHIDMMDCRKKKKPYSEEKMRNLVDAEYNILNRLVRVAENDLATNKQTLIISIFSMLSMFTVSLCYFDEQYYFNNCNELTGENVWHDAHQNWMKIYKTLSDDWFIEKLQDYAMFDARLPTLGVDVYYTALIDQVKDLKQKVEDNQELIIALGDVELLQTVHKAITSNVEKTIELAIREAYTEAEVDIPDTLLSKAFEWAGVA